MQIITALQTSDGSELPCLISHTNLDHLWQSVPMVSIASLYSREDEGKVLHKVLFLRFFQQSPSELSRASRLFFFSQICNLVWSPR